MSYFPRYEVVPRVEDSFDNYCGNTNITTIQMNSGNDLRQSIQQNNQHEVNDYYHFDGQQTFTQNDQLNVQPNVYQNCQQSIQQTIPQIVQHTVNSNSQNNMERNLHLNIHHTYYDNLQDNIHHNDQRNNQHGKLHESHFTHNPNVSGNKIEYNKQVFPLRNIPSHSSRVNGLFLTSHDIQSKMPNIDTKMSTNKSVINMSNNFSRKLSIPEETSNGHLNYVNREYNQLEVNPYTNINEGVLPIKYMSNNLQYINRKFTNVEGTQHEIVNEELFEHGEIGGSELNSIYGEVPNVVERGSEVNHYTGIGNTIIRYETVERRADCYDGTTFKVPYNYDQSYFNNVNNNDYVPENYLPISSDNISYNEIVNKSHNNIIKSRNAHTLTESKKVSQTSEEPSQCKNVLASAIDMRRVLEEDGQSSKIDDSIEKNSIDDSILNSGEKTFQDDIQSNGKNISHNTDGEKNFNSRKRQQNDIATGHLDIDASNSDSEKANKKSKIEISFCQSSPSDSISLKNTPTSNGSEYINYFCRWKLCDFYCNDTETLYRHVCKTHSTKEKYIYCEWGTCLNGNNTDPSSYSPTKVLMADYLNHMYQHTHMKQFFCKKEGCESDGFYTKYDLERHLRVCYCTKHINLCRESNCLTTFTTGKARLAHENKFHYKNEVVMYHCPVFNCSKAFTDNSSLHRHVRLSHGLQAFELIKNLKHRSSSEKQTNKILGLLTKRVSIHLNEELSEIPSIDNGEGKILLKFYDCLDVCVHKEYKSIKDLLEKMINDMKINKIRTPVNAFINRYIRKNKSNNGIIMIDKTFILQLSHMIFKNLNILNYPIVPTSLHGESQERFAEFKMTKMYLFKKLEDDKILQQIKKGPLKRSDDIDESFDKMPDQLDESDKYVEEYVFVEDELVCFGRPINLFIFDDQKLTNMSMSCNAISRRNQDKARNGINSPTLKNHKSNEFCPAYLMRVLFDYKKYLNSSKGGNFLEYKSKVPLFTKAPQEYKEDSMDKRNDRTNGNGRTNNNKESTIMVMDESDVEEEETNE